MPLLLNIDTATDHASVCITDAGKLLGMQSNSNQKEHASFLHPAIQTLLTELSIKPNMLDAVAVTAGPGSYTGLRVGMAAAKGLCYAIDKPLIAVNTLKVMASAAIGQVQQQDNMKVETGLFCPMIDARRMEVFTAIFQKTLQPVLQPCAMVLNEGSFEDWTSDVIYFFGSGAEKMRPFLQKDNMIIHVQHTAYELGLLASELYKTKTFANIAYLEPEYLKEFYTAGTK